MTEENARTWIDADGNPHPIEVFLAPEYGRELLAISLQRTRRRAGKLLAELLQTVDQPVPDTDRIRALAAGIRFESELAEEMALSLADQSRRSGFNC